MHSSGLSFCHTNLVRIALVVVTLRRPLCNYLITSYLHILIYVLKAIRNCLSIKALTITQCNSQCVVILLVMTLIYCYICRHTVLYLYITQLHINI